LVVEGVMWDTELVLQVDLHLVTVKQLKILHKAMMMMMMTIH
jgi:hypothetical protein